MKLFKIWPLSCLVLFSGLVWQCSPFANQESTFLKHNQHIADSIQQINYQIRVYNDSIDSGALDSASLLSFALINDNLTPLQDSLQTTINSILSGLSDSEMRNRKVPRAILVKQGKAQYFVDQAAQIRLALSPLAEALNHEALLEQKLQLLPEGIEAEGPRWPKKMLYDLPAYQSISILQGWLLNAAILHQDLLQAAWKNLQKELDIPTDKSPD